MQCFNLSSVHSQSFKHHHCQWRWSRGIWPWSEKVLRRALKKIEKEKSCPILKDVSSPCKTFHNLNPSSFPQKFFASRWRSTETPGVRSRRQTSLPPSLTRMPSSTTSSTTSSTITPTSLTPLAGQGAKDGISTPNNQPGTKRLPGTHTSSLPRPSRRHKNIPSLHSLHSPSSSPTSKKPVKKMSSLPLPSSSTPSNQPSGTKRNGSQPRRSIPTSCASNNVRTSSASDSNTRGDRKPARPTSLNLRKGTEPQTSSQSPFDSQTSSIRSPFE